MFLCINTKMRNKHAKKNISKDHAAMGIMVAKNNKTA